uniref:Unkown protein n=1 Tax=Riptortus pedestris TaxID=329032 RepID=R4WKR8_RIPPE|nr:unkown protein [Riptortus pedestris]
MTHGMHARPYNLNKFAMLYLKIILEYDFHLLNTTSKCFLSKMELPPIRFQQKLWSL